MTVSDTPEFVLYCGPMYAAKTSRVILEAQNHTYRGRRIVAYKPKIDDRYSKNEITTHSGMVSLPATLIETGKDLIRHLVSVEPIESKNTTVVIDEVFMIPGVADELIWLYRNGFSILASSLDMGSGMEVFPEIAKIMPWTTHVEKCTAVCSSCKGPARYTWRKPEAAADFILVGGVETYEARCAACHPLFKVE